MFYDKCIQMSVEKSEGKSPRRRIGCGWEDNIKIERENVDWIHLAQDGAQWRSVVNTVMKGRDP